MISIMLYSSDDMIRNIAAEATFDPTSLGTGTSGESEEDVASPQYIDFS
jgi:hypothetical protein